MALTVDLKRGEWSDWLLASRSAWTKALSNWFNPHETMIFGDKMDAEDIWLIQWLLRNESIPSSSQTCSYCWYHMRTRTSWPSCNSPSKRRVGVQTNDHLTTRVKRLDHFTLRTQRTTELATIFSSKGYLFLTISCCTFSRVLMAFSLF